MIYVYASSTLVVENSTFINSNPSTTVTIKGDAYSSVTIYSSRFFNIVSGSYGVVYTQGPLEIVDCLFDGNSVSSSDAAVVHSMEDVIIRDSRFIRNNATYLRYYDYRDSNYPSYTRGGSAIRGQRSINIYNCTFSFFTQTSSVIYYNNYDQEGLYHVYITDSKFYHSSRSIYSHSNVTIVDSSFSNITSSGAGGVVYSTKSVAITNCMFTDSTAVHGDGGVIYSQQWISIANSVLINSSAELGSGGAVYAVQDCTAVNSEFRSCIANNGNGGGIYSGNDVKVINCTMSECSATNGTGGAIYSAAKLMDLNVESNIVLSQSTFSHNTAECGGVLYTSGHYDHHMEFTDSTFFFNEANTTGGGVGFVENTTLSITNCIFDKNVAETVGGVLDLSFSRVTIEHSSFSQNHADENGGVFHGQKYSTNFTIAHTIMDHNSAGNGGVFYIRRSNSNINITDSKLISNSAGNQGGVMDLGGVTLTMDMDTVIINNSAGSSGNVISACVSQISTYGLEARLDPVYPLYCSIYNEGNSSTGASHTHSPYEATTSPPSDTTSQLPHEGSTTALGTTIATATTMLLSETNDPTHFSRSMDSSVTTDPDRFAVQQVEQDKYNDVHVWNSSQHNLLQVSIISLMVLCIVCTAVCVMMITLFFIVYKKRRGPRLVTRASDKKLSPVDKDQGETQHENEYSFSEI